MKTVRVALVENDTDISDVVREVLEAEGHEVLIFPSAVDFMSKKQDIGKVDFIFSDFYMPGLTGGELCQNLKKEEAYKEVPFILMSARKLGPKELDEFPGCRFLQKPFSLDELLGIVTPL